MDVRYTHTTDVHNLDAPSQIIPILLNLFHPNCIVDFGCGIGTFLNIFIKNGVSDVLGIDGTWVNQELLTANIPLNKFQTANLEMPISLEKKYDMALCLEVAEHLKESSARILVDNLTDASDLIIFSAAIPFQGGQNHINEQWPSYWQDLFDAKGYKMIDILRPILWNNQNVFFWYKQNIFVVAKEGTTSYNMAINIHHDNTNANSIVHPELFYQKINLANQKESEINNIIKGNKSGLFYLSIIKNYFLRKLHLIKK